MPYMLEKGENQGIDDLNGYCVWGVQYPLRIDGRDMNADAP
jgi:hypothetical protein